MITALAITLHLSCGMPERILVTRGDWFADLPVTPVVRRIEAGEIEWGYLVRAKAWEKYRLDKARAELLAAGGKVTEIDTCKST